MDNYFLGGFGNRTFIRPQYEIMEDGSLREIGDDRWKEFPNGGTVSVEIPYDNDADNLKNRLLKFKIDFEKDFHPNYSIMSDNSNKYRIPMTNVEDYDREEIIEIIDIDCTIEELLNDKTKRIIRIKHKPNKLILLKINQDCYGPFEFMVTEVEDSYGDEAFYTLKVFVNSGYINTYKYYDIENIVYEGNYSIRRSDRMKFIYSLDELERVQSIEQIEYFDNEELANFFKSVIDKSKEIENIADIREQFLQIADAFSEGETHSDKVKIQRICELLQTSVDLSDYKVKLMEEYFRSNPNAEVDKERYLSTHDELLTSIAREDIKYEEKTEELSKELDILQARRDALKEDIEIEEKKLEDKHVELERLGEEAISNKKNEIEMMEKKIDEIRQEIVKATKECEQKEKDRDFWKKQSDDLREECNTITNDINSKINEWVAENRNSDIIRLLVSQLEMPEEGEEMVPKRIENLRALDGVQEAIDQLTKKLNDAGRVTTKDEVINYLICVVQNYITVFAGEPGTGKTSLCKLLAKALGLYDDRFAVISVDRGWTSSKDLIGYYNPLTKEIEQTQPKFSKCMKQLDAENRNNIVEAPYFVLLDEANLSPIEFYWAHFNHFCDDPSSQIISYSNGEKYEFGSELKFLATINYDQTTTDLSPRFLDRAWVITMNPASVETIATSLLSDTDVSNNEEIISLASLNSIFGWENVKDKKLNQVTRTRLDTIVDKMKEGGHVVSPRSLHSIVHYCLVAEKYMTSKEVALDYAISQKILPSINGNGKKYNEFLVGLLGICKENQLMRSASIIAKIIEKSEHDFYGFFSL